MIPLRDLSWQFFALTGSVDAYLLFKDVERIQLQREHETKPVADEESLIEETYD